MGDQNHDRVCEVFLKACELPPAQRPKFLDGACAGEPQLRADVEALLSHDSVATGQLSPDAVRSVVPELLHQGAETERSGLSIGPYRILELLGEGGMGTVFLVQQDEPIKRRLALKVVKLGMSTRSVLARFESERQALAILDHPHISRVIDAGATRDGRPYFVMEHVPGKSITDFCDSERLTLRQRLELFLPVCRAIQHAHDHGIIHRDIKPSNILVSMRDGEPFPKIIDFGVAKATHEPLTEKTLQTQTGLMLGTPGYMSPEQAKLDGREVASATDIYSLGVVLYELLVGAMPFDLGKLRDRGLDEMFRAIREDDPPTPSTRASSLGAELTTAVEKRRTTPTAFRKSLRDELDWITMRALEKEPERRYTSAAELMQDVQRHLEQKPVLARPPTDFYRLKKWIRRRWMALAAFGIMAGLVMAAMLGGAIWQRSLQPDSAAQTAIKNTALGSSTGPEREPRSSPPPAHRQLTFSGRATMAEVSPDGRSLAYVEEIDDKIEKLSVRDLTGGESQELLQSDEIMSTRWSPDGTKLLVRLKENQDLNAYVVPVSGGPARRLPFWQVHVWSPDGLSIAGSKLETRAIHILDAASGRESSVVKLEDAFLWTTDSDWSPSGFFAMATNSEEDRHAIWTVSLEDSHQQKILEEADRILKVRWSADGKAVYYLIARQDSWNLMKIRVDAESGEAVADPETLYTGLDARAGLFSVAYDRNTLVYPKLTQRSNLWLVTLDSNAATAKILETRQLTSGTVRDSWPAVSPDGHEVAFVRGGNIWTIPLAGGPGRQLTFTESRKGSPAWSPDGLSIAYGSNEGGITRVWRVSAAGGPGRAFEKTRLSSSQTVAWAPGERILYHRSGNRNFHLLDPESAAEVLLVPDDSPGYMFSSSYSPDGTRVAIAWSRRWPEIGPRRDVWTVSVGDSSEARFHPQSTNSFPLGWSADGEWIYAWKPEANPPAAVRIPVAGGEPETLFQWPFPVSLSRGVSIRSTLAQDRHRDCAPAHGGKQWVCEVSERSSDVWLVENFDPDVD